MSTNIQRQPVRERRIIDIGCGTDRIPGAVRLDMNPAVEPDVLFEITRGSKIPFGNCSFDEIHLRDIVEHVDNVPWMLSEVHRVGSRGAKVHIRYPHFSCTNNYGDVTHQRKLSLRCFDHFDPATEYGDKYKYFGFFGRNFTFKIKRKTPIFAPSRVSGFSQYLFNLFGEDRYEQRLSTLFPIENVEMEMEVLKEDVN